MGSKKKRIVLVEDEDTLANLIELGLKDAGYDVLVERDGRLGLQTIEKAKPDLVLLDIMLPGMNGFDVLEELFKKGILPRLPVIIISNSGEPVEIERMIKMGVKDYLIKINFNPEEVIQKVDHLFRALEEEQGIVPKKSATKKTILVIEDDIVLADVLITKFTEEGHGAFKATSVTEGRRFLQKQDIDVILLDLVLPDETGFDFLRELKEHKEWKSIPVVIASNLGQKEEVKHGIELGATDYIIKAEALPGQILEKLELVTKKR